MQTRKQPLAGNNIHKQLLLPNILTLAHTETIKTWALGRV